MRPQQNQVFIPQETYSNSVYKALPSKAELELWIINGYSLKKIAEFFELNLYILKRLGGTYGIRFK